MQCDALHMTGLAGSACLSCFAGMAFLVVMWLMTWTHGRMGHGARLVGTWERAGATERRLGSL